MTSADLVRAAAVSSEPTKATVPLARRIFGADNTAINWFHIGLVAPGIAMLKHRPQYVQYTPHVGIAVAIVHLLAITQKQDR
ncbi:hypothetical protein BDZ88DRAFT_450803 [Geranomyces variabilis]|nr:hypothetical protein BDZ88DRAFT_450803 [Geranomyces variabilis]KAJ3134785.1 hypothetical protein HDU90_004815 [Geranomyces variabilis]